MEKLLKQNDQRYHVLMEVAKLRDPELKAAALSRGYPMEKIKGGSLAELTTWVVDNYDKVPDPNLLKGTALPKNPIKLGESLERKKEEKVIQKAQKAAKKNSPKKERNQELGVYKGTKKEYTYHLAKDLYTKFGKDYSKKELISEYAEQAYEKVKKKFGTVSDKSVKIWMKRCLDSLK